MVAAVTVTMTYMHMQKCSDDDMYKANLHKSQHITQAMSHLALVLHIKTYTNVIWPCMCDITCLKRASVNHRMQGRQDYLAAVKEHRPDLRGQNH